MPRHNVPFNNASRYLLPHCPAVSSGVGTGVWATLSGSLHPAPDTSLTRHNLAWCCWYLCEPCWEVSEQLCPVGLLLEKALFGCVVRRGGIREVCPHCCCTLGAWPISLQWTTGLMPGESSSQRSGLASLADQRQHQAKLSLWQQSHAWGKEEKQEGSWARMKGRHQHLLLILGVRAKSRGLAVVSPPSRAVGSALSEEQGGHVSARDAAHSFPCPEASALQNSLTFQGTIS